MLYSYIPRKIRNVHENYCVSSSWHTLVCPSTLARSNAVFPSCVKYNIQYNSEWLLWLNRRSSSCFYAWMSHAEFEYDTSYVYNHLWTIAGKVTELKIVKTRGKPLPWIVGLESLDLLPVEAWNSSTQWTGSHSMYVPVFLPNSSANTLNQNLIHLVGKVHVCFMLDQFPDNPHISLLSCSHECCLLSALGSN